MPPQEPAPVSPSEPQRRFGHYELLKELGRGAQGVVHLAEDTRLHRQVALKMLSNVGARSGEARSRFEREAALTSKIQHPGICGVYEVGEVDAVPFIAMQFVRGVTLADLLVQARGDPSKPKSTDTISFRGTTTKGELQDLMRLIERAARALHAAHEAGLVHRDIKPANIMVTPDGDPVLLDFGLARDVGSEGAGLTQSGQIMGTPAYLAPEQIVAERGGVDRRADVYALGVTLFECLTMKRPYDAPSWDQLFHKILSGNLSNCRKLNPRIPQDLRTVIEVAMDREPQKRYATAEQFADDLRRVRSFEPIKARAAGPLQRVVKWSRRHPGRAASLLSGVLAVVVGGGALLLAEWNRRAAVEYDLQLAEQGRTAADFDGALAALARVLERDPESLRARELKARVEQERTNAANEAKRQQALTAAEAARVESRAAQANYAQLQERIEQERREMTAQRPRVFDKYAEAAERATLATRERRLRAMEQESLQLLIRAQEALDRAARLEQEWGGPSAVTEAERASFFLSRWREAIARADAAAAAAFRAAVEYHDAGGTHRSELLGRGNLQIDVEPPGATVHLFRYESYETVRADDVIPRLVPVPTRGVGRARDGGYAHGLVPGDPCLCITGVKPGSPAHALGLRSGDLVVGIQGAACGSGLFVREVSPELQAAAVAPYARVASLNGKPVEDGFDWVHLPRAGDQDRIVFTPGKEVVCPREGVAVARASDLAAGGGPADLHLQCLHDGEGIELVVPAGQGSGLTTEVTAYPLLCCADNLVASGAPFEVDPGSYLLFVCGQGMEPQRLPVHVERGANAKVAARLLPEGSTPPGFVWVPPGPTRFGGDAQAFRGTPLKESEVDGFFLARLEVTNREYYEFLNEPEVRQRIAAAPPPIVLVPRDSDGKQLAKQQEDGTWKWTAYKVEAADTPVLGVAWRDVQQYLAWRNHRAETAGEPWVYDLPSRDEWERAARGADGRCFPWGNRFDPGLTVNRHRKFDWLLDVGGGFERRDESPFGILDLGGSREEWTRDVVTSNKVGEELQRSFAKCGGHWQTGTEVAFRAASRKDAGETHAASAHGFRLLVRRR